MSIQHITGSFKTIARRSVRDRWVWLVLGIVLFVVSWIIGATANAETFVGLANAAEVAETAAAASDPLVDMIRTSGPAGGLVLVLGWFIRTWQADGKAQAAKTEVAIEKLRERIESAHTSDSAINTALAVIREQMASFERRVNRLERRSSGTHPRADDE
jgi:hypothetical protein